MSIRINVSWAFIGNFVYSFSQWVYVSVIAKLLGVTELGFFALALAIVSPIFAFANFNLRAVQATDHECKYSFSEFFTFTVIGCLTACVFTVLVAFLLFDNTNILILVVIYSLVKFSESLSNICFGLFQKNENLRLVSISLMLRSALSMFFLIAVAYYFKSLFIICLAMLFSYFIVFIFFDVSAVSRFRENFKISLSRKNIIHYKVLLYTVLPLGFTMFSNVFYQSVPRYFIENYHGLKELGFYSGVMYFMIVGAVIVNAIGQAVLPRLAKYYLDENSGFVILVFKVFCFSIFIGGCGILLVILFGEDILTVVYTEEFNTKNELFVLVMWVSLIMYISGCLGTALTAMQVFYSQGKVSAIVLISLLIGCYLVVPSYGAIGAVYVMLFSYLLKVFIELYYLITVYNSRNLVT